MKEIYSRKIHIYLILFILTIIACTNSQTQTKDIKVKEDINQTQIKNENVKDTTLLEVLIAKFGKPITSEKYAELYIIYKWESTEDEYGRKFKFEIDKFLNILPFNKKTDFSEEKGEPVIIDTYEWETPQIYVELKDSFTSIGNDKIKSTISVKIGAK